MLRMTEISLKLGRFVEGMAPVFSRSAWDCTWHLIQVIFGGLTFYSLLLQLKVKLIPINLDFFTYFLVNIRIEFDFVILKFLVFNFFI